MKLAIGFIVGLLAATYINAQITIKTDWLPHSEPTDIPGIPYAQIGLRSDGFVVWRSIDGHRAVVTIPTAAK